MPSLLRYDAPRARYTWHGSFEQRALPKAAGFFWDGPSRCWATTDAAKAARLAEYADGEDRVKLLALVQKNAEAIAASSATDGPAGLEIPRPPGLAYLPFQRAGIAYASARPSCLIGDEMGLGKTIQALGVINADATIRRALVICPASLRLNWAREAQKWLVAKPSVFVVDGGKPKDFPKNLASSSDFFLVMNYDVVHKHRESIDTLGALDLMIVDEAHGLKNPKALRTKAILGGLGKKDGPPPIACRRKVFLTGTPIMNKPVELWPLLYSIDPVKFPFFPFVKKYCAAERGRFGWDFSGASRLPELQEELRKTCMVRRLKAAVLPELPPKRRQVLAIEDPKISGLVLKELDLLNAKAHGQDEALESMRDRLEAVKAGIDTETDWGEACAEYAAACRVAFDEIAKVSHEVAVAKIPHVLEHVLGLVTPDPDYKVIVFARHHDVIDGLVEGLRAAGISTVKVDGRDDMDARQAAVDGFQGTLDQPGPAQVFVGQIKAAGVGLTLTAAAHVVFAELDWVPANLSQAEDRCHRIGQAAGSVLVQHVVLAGSLDERMAEKIVEKQDVADRALDDDQIGVALPELPAPKNSASSSDRGVPTSFDALVRRGAKMTAEERLAAHAAVRMLADMCDGAFTRDGMGFNRLDARIGKALAMLDGTCLTDRQAAYCERLAIKYSRQTGFEKKKEVEK